MVIDLLVPFLFATNDLSDMLHSELPWEKQDLRRNIPRSLLINELVNFLTFIQKQFWLDVALSRQILLLRLLVKHVFQSLMSYMYWLGIQIFNFMQIEILQAGK